MAKKNGNGGGNGGGGGGGNGGGNGNANQNNNGGGGGQGNGGGNGNANNNANHNNNNNAGLSNKQAAPAGNGGGGTNAGNGSNQNVAGLGGSTAAPVHNGGGGSQAPASAGPNHPNNNNRNGGGGTSAQEGGTGPLHGNAPAGGNGGGGGGGKNQGQGNGPGGVGAGGGNGGGNNPSWTNDYQQWLKDHPHPGNNPNAGSVNAPDGVNKWNEAYHAWLKDHPHPGNAGNGNKDGSNNGPGGTDIGVPPYANTGGYAADPGSTASSDGTSEQPVYGGTDNGDGGGSAAPFDPLANLPGLPGGLDLDNLNSLANQQPGQTVTPATGNSGGFQVPADIMDKLPLQPGMLSHIVNPGDTMSGIAQQNGLSLADIKALNPQIPNPSMIFPGQAINLGNSGANATQAVGGIAPPDTSASDFPTSSTYPPADEAGAQRQSVGRIKGFGKRLRGWGAGGNLASDPAQNAMYISSERNTNPLDIKDGRNPGGHGQDTSNPS